MKAPMVLSFASDLSGLLGTGLRKVHWMICTVENPRNKFFERSVA